MTRPLAGRRVAVTRSRHQASELTGRLEVLGAEVVEVPLIEIVAPPGGDEPFVAALSDADRYAWIVVASPNGARRLAALYPSAASGAPMPLVACVGSGTASVLAAADIKVALVPGRSVAEGLVASFPVAPGTGSSVLLVQAEVSRSVLSDGLRAKGWQVDPVVAYRTVDAAVSERDRQQLATVDAITFTSSSTVDRFVRLVGKVHLPGAVVTIGPITSSTAHSHDIVVDVEADPHNLDGLVSAVVAWAGEHPVRS